MVFKLWREWSGLKEVIWLFGVIFDGWFVVFWIFKFFKVVIFLSLFNVVNWLFLIYKFFKLINFVWFNGLRLVILLFFIYKKCNSLNLFLVKGFKFVILSEFWKDNFFKFFRYWIFFILEIMIFFKIILFSLFNFVWVIVLEVWDLFNCFLIFFVKVGLGNSVLIGVVLFKIVFVYNWGIISCVFVIVSVLFGGFLFVLIVVNFFDWGIFELLVVEFCFFVDEVFGIFFFEIDEIFFLLEDVIVLVVLVKVVIGSSKLLVKSKVLIVEMYIFFINFIFWYFFNYSEY